MRTRLLFAITLLLVPGTLLAQTPPEVGDGRIAGAPVLPVETRDLKPNEVTVLNIHPGYHLTLEFPASIYRVDAGMRDIFQVDHEDYFLFIDPIEPLLDETTLTVILADAFGDGRLTLVPFLVRSDTTQPASQTVRFNDPLSDHLNRSEAEIAQRLSSNVDRRVDTLAEERVRERILFKSGTIQIGKRDDVGPRGERVGFMVDDAEQMPGPAGEERVYIRYRIQNDTPIALEDAYVSARVRTQDRRWLFFSNESSRPHPYVEDLRSSTIIPPSGSVRGLIIFDELGLRPGQSLDLQLTSFDGRRTVEIPNVLVGPSR